ncbi:MAG: FKBP-type peptidyl-prolyl cis-trans isomerase [Saprospiraceae bacterium]|nr:FKBP-type peptidyl-prolyl cis-trans isomerase [Saprospiraceae bacterium]MCB9318828.1 FKBP-type peptidyl-prolyl cis-trans isomerase [Lewinellaceae bacterium]
MRTTFLGCIVLSIGLLSFGSCSKGSKSGGTEVGEFLKTPTGFTYYLFERGPGRKINVGEVAYFNVIEVMDDSVVLQNSWVDRKLRKNQISEAGQISRDVGPIMDVLREMHIGDSVSFTLTPRDLNIPTEAFQFDHLTYFMKLEKIKSQSQWQAEKDSMQAVFDHYVDSVRLLTEPMKQKLQADIKAWKGEYADKIQRTPSGIEYYVHTLGTGLVIENGVGVAINYVGALEDGTVFDDSYHDGRPYAFTFGRGTVIKAWDDIFQYLPRGSVATIWVPANLAYAEAGSPPAIPPNANLFFLVEVIE